MRIAGSHETIMRATSGRIWRVLEDTARLGEWVAIVKHTTGVRETTGSVRTCEVEWGGRKEAIVERCTEAIPNRRIAWVMERGMMLKMFSKFAFGFTLERTGAETTLVRMDYCYEAKNNLAGLLFRLTLARKLDRARRMILSNLKALVEARDSPAAARIME